ncbi:MAG: hypothetical protein Q4A65_05800 [Bacillota bacterium]|nr:hypothetical protein [Bacillota bacterium]
MMKHILPLIIAFVFAFATFMSGCTDGTVNRSEELKEVLETAQANLNDAFSEESCDYALISEFLKSWAEGCNVEVEKAASHYTVLYNPATEDGTDKKVTTLQCALHTDDIQGDLNALSTALACLLGPTEHNGIRLIVTDIYHRELLGAAAVDKKYLNCDGFINLSNSSDYSLHVAGADTARAVIQTSAKKKAPAYGSAFEITMSFNKFADPFRFDKKNNYPDPIRTIGDLLAGAKSSGKLFEIASFTSEADPGYLPHKVKAVVVLDANSVESLNSRFEKSYKSVENKFDNVDSDFVYTINETEVPSSVLSEKASNELISLMYTLKTGICEQDEETGLIYSASYLSSISTKDKVKVTVDIRTRGTDYMNALSNDYETTSGLCNMKYSISDSHPAWTSSDDSELAGYFSNLVPLAEGTSDIMLPMNELDLFAKKNTKLNAIAYSFAKDGSKNVMRNITNYLDASEEE